LFEPDLCTLSNDDGKWQTPPNGYVAPTAGGRLEGHRGMPGEDRRQRTASVRAMKKTDGAAAAQAAGLTRPNYRF
jgi:hypothetical protein